MKCVFCGGTEKAAVTEYVVIKSIEKILDAIQRVASELTVTVIDYRQNSAA